MRIALLTTEYPPFYGGVATWSGGVARALAEAGHDVRVFAHLGGGATGAAAEDVSAAVPVTRLHGRSWNRWGHLWTAAQVRPRLREGELVLAATWPLAGALVGQAPLAVAWHGSDLTRAPVIAGREVVAAAAVNLPVSRFLGGVLGAAHTVLPYPIRPGPPARRGDKLLVIARLNAQKGVDRAIRLAARLGRPIDVVGDGPERPHLEALAVELGVAATFRGFTREIPWEGTWAVALLSRPYPDGSGAEGLGLVLLEAAARGVPSIGSRVGGIPEAASAVLDDPDVDPVPELPDVDAVQGWLAANHGPERCVAAFEGVVAAGVGAD